jgi:hypothetical protein
MKAGGTLSTGLAVICLSLFAIALLRAQKT